MYELYMLCFNCGCVDLYSYEKKHGVLLSMWKNNDTAPKIGPTICNHCHHDFPNVNGMDLRVRILTDVTEQSFASMVTANVYMVSTYTPKLVPKPALIQNDYVLPISTGMLPDLEGARGSVIRNVNVCSRHH